MPLGFTFWYSYPVSALINSQNARNKYFLVFFIFSIFFSNINGFMFKVYCLYIINSFCRFLELSSTLEPDRPATTDKLAILGDTIRVLNQLKSETQDFKEMNEKLSEEIKTLKAEKNELREEKLVLKAEKAKMEQQVKSMTSNIPPPGFMAPHPAAFQAGANKMPVFPGYGYNPMWQYLPPSTCDTSHDHELRPPAA
ncbi:putative helix-loop-helix DNA-binding domain superfamily [Helianthus annuus]|uniref:Helix-loop-helix DNA-binding domain superfamily n=1 Tax=Helianthus annuus TaxID=4232 RepID=A0A9K3EKI0_HELAN|nr:putative helix-loop-helix DNA-binding domain superfamily [Helianthus annuus]KAJ0665500.1 putative transcription factor ILR3 [Helianthus annuus]KAJ0851237.1 putative helix-loop-helix DNA-binding domain superfamily [Helianthus annuus]